MIDLGLAHNISNENATFMVKILGLDVAVIVDGFLS